MSDLHAVTGAFGFTGGYLARRLLDSGFRVRTLTNSHRRPDPFGGAVEVRPLDFSRPGELEESLRGVRVLHNTYWVRFNHRNFTHEQAIRNTMELFGAAKRAGVERIVHVSIANPSLDSPLGYYRGKARLEEALRATGISHAIVRPALLFGRGDILVNNIAWMLRRLPVFGLVGDGRYRVRPVLVDDMAELMAGLAGSREDATVDAVGPESFEFRELVRVVAAALGRRRLIVPVPWWAGYAAGKAMGWLMRDIVLTLDEVRGLRAGLLDTKGAATAPVRFTEWVVANAESLGVRYASELGRRDRGSRRGLSGDARKL